MAAADVYFKRLQSVQNAVLDWSLVQFVTITTTSHRFLQYSTGLQGARELCSRLWCWCSSVLVALLPATSLHFCCLCFRLSASQVSRPTTSSQSANHDRPAELRYCGTVSVEQSSGCSPQTGDDTADFQATTQGLSVPHLMC